MRVLLFVLVLCCILFVVSEASKKGGRRKWKKMKMMKKLAKQQGHHGNGLNKKGFRVQGQGPKYHHKQKAKHHKKRKFHPKNKLAWLKFKSGPECGLNCSHGEVCIAGLVDAKPMCARKKDLVKSLKLFHRYQVKEMKAWRKFQKHNYKDVATKSELLKYDLENDMMSNKKKHHSAQHGKKHHQLDHGKKHHKLDQTGKHVTKPGAPPKTDSTDECSTSLFSQMRTRLMGWFHLLHGQDHMAKKETNMNLKHFHKHVSVKKELRQHNGDRCGCFKSAMWQFHQMDKNEDDFIDENETSFLEENSLEPCIQPYLTSCDRDGDRQLSSDEWCCCFANIVAPCFKKLDEIRWSGHAVTYMPRCDKEGYYMREQCSGETKDKFKCWCVDYNGNELEGTASEGRASCSKLAVARPEKPAPAA